jgi:arylsulfatase A-like enzyme
VDIVRALRLGLILICLSAGCSSSSGDSSGSGEADKRPNILLIVADDLGYADLGVYGSDIQTPNIDALASQGMLFTQFHTAPMCAPTRAMLLSGNNNHVAGVGRQSRVGLVGSPVRGYEGGLSDRIVPFPRLLAEAGYNTYTVGKWHLGLEAESSPKAAGFSRSFNLLNGAGSHFDATGLREGGSTYRRDGVLAEYPAGRYSTELYTDLLIEFIEADEGDGKPFFAYAAYTSPHWPLQVPDEYLDLYRGHYDEGYDALRERRFESLQEAGIVPLASKLPPRNDDVTPWQDLTPDERRIESRKMELYAAMLDNLDDNVGRLLGYLKANGLYENTLIVFMSDNGAADEDPYNDTIRGGYIRANFDNAYDKMGTADSFVAYGKPWAEAGSAPFQRHKGYTREGGIVAPLIVAGPGVASRGVTDPTYLSVMDLAPTFLEVAGADYPEQQSVRPMLGASIVKFLAGLADSVHGDDYVTALFHEGRAFLRQGRWKIATLEPPFDEKAFELFDVETDPGETDNLAEDEPEKFAELIELWREERRRLGILLPEDL